MTLKICLVGRSSPPPLTATSAHSGPVPTCPSLWLRMSRSTVLPHSTPMAPSFQLWMTQTTWVSEKLEVSGHHPFRNALCRLPPLSMLAVCMTYSTPLLENWQQASLWLDKPTYSSRLMKETCLLFSSSLSIMHSCISSSATLSASKQSPSLATLQAHFRWYFIY